MQYVQYYLLFIYGVLIPITSIGFLCKITDIIGDIKERLDKKQQPEAEVKKRIHGNIGKSDYDNAFGGRKAYEIYKNQDGLYEPVMPSKGIELKKKEE